MHSSDLEAFRKKCIYCWFQLRSFILMRFGVFLDLLILAYFNAIFRPNYFAERSLLWQTYPNRKDLVTNWMHRNVLKAFGRRWCYLVPFWRQNLKHCGGLLRSKYGNCAIKILITILFLIEYISWVRPYGCTKLMTLTLILDLPVGALVSARLVLSFQEVSWLIWRSYSAIWSLHLTNVKWHSDPWPVIVTSQPIRLSTNFMTLIPSLTFTELRVISMEDLQRV